MRSLKNIENLPQSVINLVDIVLETAKPEKLMLFGSRARGNHRSNSDFDFVVFTKNCSENDWTNLLINLSEGPHSLYNVEIVEYEKLSPEYQENISREGKVIYECTNQFPKDIA